jgi:Ca2+-transporting ATPase
MEELLGQHWHHLPADEVVQLLGGNPEKGLDLFDIKHRRRRFGPNVISRKKSRGPLLRFLSQFHNPLVYILVVSSVITAIFKDVVDAATIFGVVLINAVIGFVQEARAEKAIEALADTMNADARVLRGRQTVLIPATDLVPGDIVALQAGDKVPADLRLLRTRDLRIAEAALTGESLPVAKDADSKLPPVTVLAERCNMAYATTLVTTGQGTGIVTATGDKTEVGRISELLTAAQEQETPLMRRITRFSGLLLWVIVTLAAVTFAVGVLRGQSTLDTFMAAIALAVGAIPEGLPAAVTITLAIGVSRMARRRAMIRKLPAVETLGSTNVVCSDKTGTLTQNQMTVQQAMAGGHRYSVTGSGYNPKGDILCGDGSCDFGDNAALVDCLRAGLLCNDSHLAAVEGRWEAQGDPTEVALIVFAHKAGLERERVEPEYPRRDTIPFDSEYRFMATLHEAAHGRGGVVYLKGAVETLLDKCSRALDAAGGHGPLDRAVVLRAMETMAGDGLRVLALARGEWPNNELPFTPVHLPDNLTFLGLQGMIDPPRPEAVQAVAACQKAGIRVKMITGDHAVTAAAIARHIGLQGGILGEGSQGAVLTGREMAALADEQLIQAAAETAVFARVSPEQKLRLVEALQARGNIVAMTGDGVNDAPALKQADIGVAMGITGTEVAKEAADMVLMDDNFASIEAAVEEGRGVFDNLTKFLTWALPANLGGALVILAAVLTGVDLPILPVQALWINMTTAGILGLVLALEPKEAGIMSRPPRDPAAPILTRSLLTRIVMVGCMTLVGAFGLFEWVEMLGGSLAQARTVAVNVIVVVQLFYLVNCRSLSQSIFRVGIGSNPWMIVCVFVMIVLQLMFTYTPLMNRLMSSAPIPWRFWGPIAAVGVLSYLVVEVDKWVRRRAGSALVRP